MTDKILVKEAQKRITAKDSILGERAAATAVWAAMKAKTKIGMGMKTKKRKLTKKRMLPVARSIILSILVSYLFYCYWESLIRWSATRVAKAIYDNKAAQHQLEELKRNRIMKGHGIYLVPYKHKQGNNGKN